MDVNNNDQDHEIDTLNSPDDTGFTRTVTEGHDVGFTNVEEQHGNVEDQLGDGINTVPETVEYAVEGQEKPLLKDAKTGKFIKGTGHSGKGGRKIGSKDRVSQKLVDIAQSLMERRGAELLEEVADRAPEQALALITKIIPASELTKLFEQDRAETELRDHTININLVGGTSLPRPENAIEAPVQRIKHTPDDLATVISEGAYMATEEPVERAPEPSREDKFRAVQDAQEEADRLAVERERERVAIQNENIKRHGGRTGLKRRGGGGHWQDEHIEDVL